ncbi:hypothetical protein JHK85_056205 [Glycine max]|nr:hypothetical protein JHK85_056205 [Glycine max]
METWGILGNHHTRKSPPVSTVSRRKLYTTMSTMAWQSSPTATTTTPSRRALRTMGRFSRASMCHTPLPFWCWIFRRSTPRSRFSSTPETPLVNTPKSFVASAALTFGSPTRTCYATAFQKKKKPDVAKKYKHAFYHYEYVEVAYVLNLISSEGEGCPKEIDWQRAPTKKRHLQGRGTILDATGPKAWQGEAAIGSCDAALSEHNDGEVATFAVGDTMVALVACQRACVWGVGSWVGFLGKGVVEGVVVEVVRLLKAIRYKRLCVGGFEKDLPFNQDNCDEKGFLNVREKGKGLKPLFCTVFVSAERTICRKKRILGEGENKTKLRERGGIMPSLKHILNSLILQSLDGPGNTS